jgi:pentatricopeptide repeat protein
MLRAKQLGTLTQCARTFYVSGSRCGSADGASCTCSEDDASISKRQVTPVTSTASKSVDNTKPKHSSTAPSENGTSSPSQHAAGPSNPVVNNKIDSTNNSRPLKYGANHYLKPSVASSGGFSELIGSRYAETVPEQSSSIDSSQNFTYSNKSSSGGGTTRNKTSDSKGLAKTHQSVAKSPANQPPKPHAEARNGVCDCQPREKLPSGTISSGKTPVESARKVPYQGTVDAGSFNKSRQYRTMKPNAGGLVRNNNFRSMHSVQVVEQYYHTLQQLKWGPVAERALDSLHCKLDAYQANQVLKLIRDPSVALGFFQWLKCQAGFKHDCHTYTTAIGILGQAKQLVGMRNLLEEMVRDGCQPSVVTYNRLIHAYGRANYIGEAVRVFKEMQGAGHEPDRVTYCTLIDIHAKAGYLEAAMDLYRKMQQSGLSLDTFTYSVMVNCLGKGGRLAAAYKLFNEMVEKGCVPNIVTYNTMIALQAKARNYTSVVKLYRDMQAAGLRPDKITYSIVIEVLARCGHLEETETVFSEMQQDWVPDEPVYGLLVDLWGKAGNVDKAMSWYQSMLNAGLRPNVPTCNSLLSAFLRTQRYAGAYSVLQNMLNLGLVPSLQTYTLLLSCCTETHYPNKGICCELMAVTGHPAHMFLVYLPDAEPGGQNIRDHAGRFLDLMHTEDRESKRGLVDAVIDFLHRSGLKEEAGFVWEVAAQRNVYPDSVKEKNSSYWLINLHLMSEGTAVTAMSRTLAWFRRQLLVSGTGPHRIDIVTGWGRRSRVTGASLVRQSVENLLNLFEFPFLPANSNSGCFVGRGEPLNRWLQNAFVERMHLL